jgi:hypothetical protein
MQKVERIKWQTLTIDVYYDGDEFDMYIEDIVPIEKDKSEFLYEFGTMANAYDEIIQVVSEAIAEPVEIENYEVDYADEIRDAKLDR